MDVSAALRAFAAVFPAELPDKTMVATIVLVARYQQPFAVWAGAAAAFAVHVVVAVAAGSALTLLPENVVTVAIAGLFTVGAVLLWRSASSHAREAETEVAEAEAEPGGSSENETLPARAAAGTFAVIAVAEWGDLTQLATAGIAGSTGAPVAVAAGALLALWTVSALGATIGRGLVARLPLDKLQRGAACVFAALAVISLAGLL